MSPAGPAEDAFRRVADRAWSRNRERAATLDVLVADWVNRGPLTTSRWDQARLLAHSLAGSAGTLGHQRASELAADLETLLACGDDGAPGRAAELVQQICRELAQPPSGELFSSSSEESRT